MESGSSHRFLEPTRREFLLGAGGLGMLAVRGTAGNGGGATAASPPLELFLCGDVMTGRGIDQVMAHPVDPALHEPWVRDARRYVELAEAAHGRIPRPVGPEWIWGEALGELERRRPDLRIVNLETAVTAAGEPWPGKGIHYRMHPANVGCLEAAAIDCCVLANNHVLDWGRAGLEETLATLERARLATAGAGREREGAEAPAVLAAPGGRRVLVLALGSPTSGIPIAWAAGEGRSGVALVTELDAAAARRIGARLAAARRPGDLVMASIHWGPNWGWEIPAAHRRFARLLVDEAGVDLVHGHSSHHPLGIEVHRGRLVLYGCGDFVNDYEGIGGHEEYRGDLAVGYFATLAPDGRLARLELLPFQSRRFRLQRASAADTAWLGRTLDRECRKLGSRVAPGGGGTLELRWDVSG